MDRLIRNLTILYLFVCSFVSILGAQTAAPATDPLGRSTPQDSIFHFLEACHAHDYGKAAHYLDLAKMSSADRAKAGPELAQQLEDLLDDTPFDIATLSRDPSGDMSDGLSASLEHLATFHVDGKTLDLELERVAPRSDLKVWLVSAASVALIPEAHQVLAETPFEMKLPQILVTFEVLDTPVWRWIALILMGAAIWFAASLVSWTIVRIVHPLVKLHSLSGPIRVCLVALAFPAAVNLAPPSSIPRLFIERVLGLTFALGLAWAGAVLVEFAANRWQKKLDPRQQAVSYSVLPLGRQIVKVTLFLVALLSVVSAWGYNTSTILAGLGVGGLAVALAAQKTIENLFGGVSVIGDRPVLVGDVCRFGDRTGTVMHIGLRSTRIRTPERTIISVPNSQFSSVPLENISGRDKIWFHPTLNLRRDTTSEQLSQVLASIRAVLTSRDKVETGDVPVRFANVGSYSLDIEVSAYVKTANYDEFLTIQQELLLAMLQAIEAAGTALAVPLTESFEAHRTAPAPTINQSGAASA